MRRTYTTCLSVLCVIALGVFAACKDDDTTTNPTPNTGDKVHGEYLVQHVAVCGDCHTQRNQMGQPIDSLAFAGGEAFAIPQLGTVYSANITPDSVNGIGKWTDQQIIDAIRTGSAPAHSGMADSVLFPVMPYWLYGYLTDQDAKDIVAYLRSLKAVRYAVPESTIPAAAYTKWAKQAGIPDASPSTTQTQRGKYLVTLAGCIDCHTVPAATATNPLAQGVNMSLFLAGGRQFPAPADPGKFIYSLNITPDHNTGIGEWTPTQIDSAIAYGWDDEHRPLCPPMPWQAFQGMSKDDRNAIVAYIRAIPAISNVVPEDTTIHCPH